MRVRNLRAFLPLWLALALVLNACSDDGGAADAAADVGADGAPVLDGTPESAPDLATTPKHKKEVDDLVRPIMEGKWTVGLVVGLISQEGKEVHAYGATKVGGAACSRSDRSPRPSPACCWRRWSRRAG